MFDSTKIGINPRNCLNIKRILNNLVNIILTSVPMTNYSWREQRWQLSHNILVFFWEYISASKKESIHANFQFGRTSIKLRVELPLCTKKTSQGLTQHGWNVFLEPWKHKKKHSVKSVISSNNLQSRHWSLKLNHSEGSNRSIDPIH